MLADKAEKLNTPSTNNDLMDLLSDCLLDHLGRMSLKMMNQVKYNAAVI